MRLEKGQRVKIVTDHAYHLVRNGQEGSVTFATKTICSVQLDGEERLHSFFPDELEPIENELNQVVTWDLVYNDTQWRPE